MPGEREEESIFLEKKAKNFYQFGPGSALAGTVPPPTYKSFLLLFFTKEDFLAASVHGLIANCGNNNSLTAQSSLRAQALQSFLSNLVIGTFCIEHGHSLLHDDRDFVTMAEHLGLRLV